MRRGAEPLDRLLFVAADRHQHFIAAEYCMKTWRGLDPLNRASRTKAPGCAKISLRVQEGSRRSVRGQQAGYAVHKPSGGFDGSVGGLERDGSFGSGAVVGEGLQLISASQKL